MVNSFNFFSDDINKISQIIEKGEKNIFIEIEDDYLKDLIINEINNKIKFKNKIFLKEEEINYDIFLDDLIKKLDEILMKVTRGMTFSSNKPKESSRNALVIKKIRDISIVSNIILVLNRLDLAKGSFIETVDDLINLLMETKTLTIIIANPKNYNADNIKEINNIKKSKNFELIKIGNLNFKNFEQIIGEQFSLPLNIMSEIYDKSEGSLDYAFSQLMLLKKMGYIDELGRWIGPEMISIEFPTAASDLLSYQFRLLDDDKKNMLRWLSLIGESIDAEILKKVSGINESNFINALEGLLETNLIKISGNIVTFNNLKLRNFIFDSISDYSKVSMAKIVLKEVDQRSSSYIDLLMEAKEYEKAENVILDRTNNIKGTSILHYQRLLETILKVRRTEKLMRRYAKLLLMQGYKKEANEVLNEIEKTYEHPSSGFYALKAWASEPNKVDSFTGLLEKANDPVDKEWILYYKMYNLWQLGRNQDALEVGEDLLKRVTTNQIKGQIFRLFGNLVDEGELDKALEYYEQARKIAEDSGDERNLTRIFSNESNIYFAKGMEEKGFEFLNKAKEIARVNLDIPMYTLIDYNESIAKYDYQMISYNELTRKLERIESMILKYGIFSLIQNYLLSLSSIFIFALDFRKYDEYIKKAEAFMSKEGIESQISRLEILKALRRVLSGENVSINKSDIDQNEALDYAVIKLLQDDIEEANKAIEKSIDENESKYFKWLIKIMMGEKGEDMINSIYKFSNGRSIFSAFSRDLIKCLKNEDIDYEKYISSGESLTLILVAKILDKDKKKRVIDLVKRKTGYDSSMFLK